MPDADTSSANPEALAAFVNTAMQLDGQLELGAVSLRAAIAEFTATCREYPTGIDESLADQLQDLARRNVEMNMWVRQVADQFTQADTGQADSLADTAAGFIAGPLTDGAAGLPVDGVGPEVVNDVRALGVTPVLPLDGAGVISLPTFGLGQPANADGPLDVPVPTVGEPPSIGPSDRWYTDQPVNSHTSNAGLPPLTGADVGLSDAELMRVLGVVGALGATTDQPTTEPVIAASQETPPWFDSPAVSEPHLATGESIRRRLGASSGEQGIDLIALGVGIGLGTVPTTINSSGLVDGGSGVLIDPEPEPVPPLTHPEPEPFPPAVHPEPEPLPPIIDEFPEQGGGVIIHPEPPQMPTVAVSDDGGQEQGVRDLLERQGWQPPWNDVGEPLNTDDDVAAYLGLERKRADLLYFKPGNNPGEKQWLVGESKGGNLDDAYYQLQATAEALWKKDGAGATLINTELRVYMSSDQYKRTVESLAGRGGYFIRDGYLSAIDEQTGLIEPLTGIGGLKIQVFASPAPDSTPVELHP